MDYSGAGNLILNKAASQFNSSSWEERREWIQSAVAFNLKAPRPLWTRSLTALSFKPKLIFVRLTLTCLVSSSLASQTPRPNFSWLVLYPRCPSSFFFFCNFISSIVMSSLILYSKIFYRFFSSRLYLISSSLVVGPVHPLIFFF